MKRLVKRLGPVLPRGAISMGYDATMAQTSYWIRDYVWRMMMPMGGGELTPYEIIRAATRF